MGEETERPRILLTGPVGRTEEYAAAARAAGWSAHELLLVEIAPLVPSAEDARGAFDWIAVTSSNALEFLAALLARDPRLLRIPCGVVGTRSAERIEALGLRLGLPPAENARDLAQRILAAGPDTAERRAMPAGASTGGGRVLWPRGPRSSELGEALRAAGWRVEEPLAYETRPRSELDVVPDARAVFFASPSAVRAFAERFGASERAPQRALPRAGFAAGRTIGVAIGPTTLDALLEETRLALCDTISLPEPTPEALRASLEHLDVDRGP